MIVGGEGGRQFHDDLATRCSGTSPGGKWQLIRREGSTARISDELRPRWWGMTHRARDRMCVPLVDTYDYRSDGEGHVCFPLPQGFVEWPVPRPAGADDGTNCMSPLTRHAVLEGIYIYTCISINIENQL